MILRTVRCAVSELILLSQNGEIYELKKPNTQKKNCISKSEVKSKDR